MFLHLEDTIGMEPFLRDIRSRLKGGSYRPQLVRERAIPKKGAKVRRLGIPEPPWRYEHQLGSFRVLDGSTPHEYYFANANFAKNMLGPIQT